MPGNCTRVSHSRGGNATDTRTAAVAISEDPIVWGRRTGTADVWDPQRRPNRPMAFARPAIPRDSGGAVQPHANPPPRQGDILHHPLLRDMLDHAFVSIEVNALRATAETSMTNWAQKAMCGPGNSAAYGACVASEYAQLVVLDLPTAGAPVYSGSPFVLRVLKQDAYNQTIVSDSDSVVQVYAAAATGNTAAAEDDPAAPTIVGATIVRLDKGVAMFSLALKPVFLPLGPAGAALVRAPLLIFEGADAWSGSAMITGALTVAIATGLAVCPLGSVLSLSPFTSVDSGRTGECVECGSGTYSVDPLAGSTTNSSDPSCVSCPLQALQNGDCAAGGADVHFSLGTWRVINGVFHLVACPAGYQLINSVDGAFANQIQRCQQCSSDQYLLDSTNPAITCQNCPPLATCNGSVFISSMPGAIWTLSGGKYVLIGCPPGYQLLAAEQTCGLCPPLFFCTGGSAQEVACPVGDFAPAGSSTAATCVSAVFVQFSVMLDISVASFDGKAEQSFLIAIAAVAHTLPSRVVINSVAADRRASQMNSEYGGVQINVLIAAADNAQAQSIAGYLDDSALNTQLEANGLPLGMLSDVQIGDGGTTVVNYISASGTAGIIISASVVGIGLFLLIWHRGRRFESSEERMLRIKVRRILA